jgi:hypothetical protein
MWNSEHCMKSIVSTTFTNCPTDPFSSLKLYIFLASLIFTIIALVYVYNERAQHSIPLLLSSQTNILFIKYYTNNLIVRYLKVFYLFSHLLFD